MSGPFSCALKAAFELPIPSWRSERTRWDEMPQVARLVVVIAALLYFYGLDRGP